MTVIYFWGEEDASIHFCEDKYVLVSWIAEYYNTLSSLFYVIVGLMFLKTRISNLGKCLILVGIGAFALHMTLRKYAQMIDELSMLVLSFDAIRNVKSLKRRWLLPILFAYFLLHEWFVYFFIVFGAMQASNTILS